LNSSLLIIGSTIIAIFMAVTMNVLRMKTAKKPTSAKKIILPPIFMSTGALMFLFPIFRISWLQVIEAISIGAFVSILLIITTKFEIKDDEIYLKPSRSFIFILFGLFILRLVLKWIIGSHIDVGETSGLFFLLALGMIGTWRISMFVEYTQLKKRMIKTKTRMSE